MAGTLPTGGEWGSLEVEAVGSGRAAPRVGLVQQEPEGNIVMQRIGDDGNGLLRLDEELGQRVFVPPAAEA